MNEKLRLNTAIPVRNTEFFLGGEPVFMRLSRQLRKKSKKTVVTSRCFDSFSVPPPKNGGRP
jgi:hypothetical protein